MGSMAAQEMAEHGGVNEMTMRWHLTSNHYPPLSERLIEPALAAVEAFNEEDPDRVIDMGGELQNGLTEMPAWRIVDGLHLHGFVHAGAEVEL